MSNPQDNKRYGYVRLWRSSIRPENWELKINQDNDYWTFWTKILLLATHQPRKVDFAGQTIVLQPGQFITGRKRLAQLVRCSERKVERMINYFISAQQIAQQASNRNRVITILNWVLYQSDAQQIAQPPHNWRTTGAQPPHTNKNDKNGNNEKNEEEGAPSPKASIKILDDPITIAELKGKYPGIDVDEQLEIAKDWLASKGKVYKDYVAFARNWLKKPYAKKKLEAHYSNRGGVAKV